MIPTHQHNNAIDIHAASDVTMNIHYDVTMSNNRCSSQAFPGENLTNSK